MEKSPLTSSPVIDICLAVFRFALLSDALFEDFFVMSEDTAKHYLVEILEANLYVCEMTLDGDFMSAIEKILLSSPTYYSYFETRTKMFFASAGLYRGKQEDIFSLEPIHRLAICLITNEAFLGNNSLNPFHY